MSSNHLRASRTATVDANDALGHLLVKQRPDVVLSGPANAGFYHASEKISDPMAIAALLSSCSSLTDESEDDLIFELMYLETLLAAQPLRSSELLEQLGTLGDEVRDGLLPPGVVNMVAIRRRTRAIRQQMGVMASRVTAAMLVLLTSLPFFGQEAEAASPRKDANGPFNNSFQIAAAPVVRVVDSNSGQGVAGVQIKSMEEEILGVTDATGQATLSEKYMETDLLSLEKEGYQMYLLDRSQLSSRNIVSMKPLQDGGTATALLQKAPSPAASGAQAPKVVHQPGHAPKLEPPKAPSAPKSPSVKVPLRPKAPKVAASAAPKVDAHAAAPKLQTPKHDDPHTAVAPKAPVAHAVAPKAPAHVTHAVAPKAPVHDTHAAAPKPAAPKAPAAPKHETTAPISGMTEVYSAPKAAPKAAAHHAAAPASHAHAAVSKPAKPRAPIAEAPVHDSHDTEAEGVSVPKYQPEPKMEQEAGSAYVVRRGDTLSKIAKRHLGSAKRWPELYSANKGAVRNPHWIQVGQTLTIPGAQVAAHNTNSKTYVVRRGDTLSTIAAHQMGDASRWDKIFAANREAIRNPHVIYPGMRIVLPV